MPATMLTGAIGANVAANTNLRITWDAGADWNNQTSAQTRFRLKVDGLPSDLAGFSLIPGGDFTMDIRICLSALARPRPTRYRRSHGTTL